MNRTNMGVTTPKQQINFINLTKPTAMEYEKWFAKHATCLEVKSADFLLFADESFKTQKRYYNLPIAVYVSELKDGQPIFKLYKGLTTLEFIQTGQIGDLSYVITTSGKIGYVVPKGNNNGPEPVGIGKEKMDNKVLDLLEIRDQIDGIDYQILVEADFLVNLAEEQSSRETIESVKGKIFKTKTGIWLINKIF